MNVCTIVAKNYLAHARVLARSLREHHPQDTLTVLVLDGLDGYADPAQEPMRIVGPHEIGCEPFEMMSAAYTVLELSTAVKPWLLRTLLADDDHAVYLDPDIQIVGPLDELRERAVEHGIVLTPHNLTPIPRDGKYPSEESILVAGAYNLGFVALGRGPVADGFLDWWAERLETDCVADPASGRFVDQRWIDLVPGIWPTTDILRDAGYNVAYWNLHARSLARDAGGTWSVDGRPARFFHFSGYDPRRPERLSKYQDRIDLGERPEVREAADDYGKALLDAGYAETIRWPYEINGAAPADVGQRIAGVNIIGYLGTESGVGEVARQVIGALDTQGIPVAPVRVSTTSNREHHDFADEDRSSHLFDLNIICVNADMLPTVAGELGPEVLADRRSAGWWWWEVDSFPTQWTASFDLVDEVWAGSRFVATALRRIAPIPVIYIPTPVTMRPNVLPDRAQFGIPNGFVYLYVFDYNSILARKNPQGLVDAYVRGFPEPGPGVSLVLKSINGQRHPEAMAAVAAATSGREDVILIDDYLDADDRDALIASCDCYVSLHRSEGFGITLAEAMLLGKPVIGTGYGGVTDFLSDETGYVVDHELVPIGDGSAPYPADGVWAEPDLDHAAALMRRVFERPAEAADRAERGRSFIERRHSSSAAGRAIASRLAVIERPKHLGIDLKAADTAQEAMNGTLELIQAAAAPPTSRLRRLLQRVVFGRRALQRQQDIHEALWWSIEAQHLADRAALTSLDDRVRTTEASAHALSPALRRRSEATAALAEALMAQRKAILALERHLDLEPHAGDEDRIRIPSAGRD